MTGAFIGIEKQNLKSLKQSEIKLKTTNCNLYANQYSI